MYAHLPVAVLLVALLAPLAGIAQQPSRAPVPSERASLDAPKRVREADARRIVAADRFLASLDDRDKRSLQAIARAYSREDDVQARQQWGRYVDPKAGLPSGFNPSPHIDAVLHLMLENKNDAFRTLLKPNRPEIPSERRAPSADSEEILDQIRKDETLEARLIAIRSQLEHVANGVMEAAAAAKHDTAKNAINNVR